MTELHEILYGSLLASAQPPNIVGQIVSQARNRNAARGITGLLVFDGMRFCQHFEGSRADVVALMATIETDPRHTEVRVLHRSSIDRRRYARFDLGLTQGADGDDLADLLALEGQAALDRFLAMRPGFDVNG
jgi:hypothetical protein